jgi:ADP-glucose pyrophosphorylase
LVIRIWTQIQLMYLVLLPSKFEFYDPKTPFFTAPRNLPPTQLDKCKVQILWNNYYLRAGRRNIWSLDFSPLQIKDAFISDGCLLSECSIKHSVIGVCSRVSSRCELMVYALSRCMLMFYTFFCIKTLIWASRIIASIFQYAISTRGFTKS